MCKTFIRSDDGHPAQSHHIRALLGLSERAKLPAEGMPSRIIQGCKVWVAPLGSKFSHGRRMAHRVLVQCPECKAVVSVGRLAQHATEKENQSFVVVSRNVADAFGMHGLPNTIVI